MRIITLTSLLLLAFCNVTAQTILTGSVKGLNKKGVSDISVVVHPKNNPNGILAYAISGTQGEFKIEVNSTADTIGITTMSLSYKDSTLFIANRSQTINFTLTEEVTNIDEIIVRSQPIRAKGDTITYLVNSFTSAKDVSIGDVIKKMPGFEVSNEGRVYYQGQEIEKYYIEGLDLLENNYSIANRNLPHKSVGAVEVLENHQPIKMLQDKKYAAGTSVNIKLKNSITVTGTANLGAGFSPFMRDVRVSPMAFLKKQQIITTLQSNNIGEELSSQFQSIRFSGGKIEGFNEMKTNLVGISTLSTPAIDKKRYLDNNSNLISYNQLVKINDVTQLKINVNYLNDITTQQGSNETTYFIDNSTYSIKETTKNKLYTDCLSATFGLEQNSKKGYLKNKTDIRKYWDWQQGDIMTESNTHQKAETPHFSASNSLDLLFPWRNNFFRIYSLIDYNDSPQQLEFTPGVFADNINSGNSYQTTTQNSATQNLITEHSFSFTKSLRRWALETEVGIKYEKQDLQTSIQTNGVALTADSLNNNLKWDLIEPYVSEVLRYETTKLKFNFAIPLNATVYNITDLFHNSPKQVKRTKVNPRLSIHYDLNGYWKLSALASYSSFLSSPESLTQGFVISDYRNMQRRTNIMDEKNRYSYNAKANYRNAISGIFSTFSVSHSNSTKSLIYKQQMIAPGVFKFDAVESDNKTLTTNIAGDISYFIADWHTTIGVKGGYSNNKSEYLFNDTQSWVKSNSYTLSPSIVINKWRFLDIQYGYNLAFINQNTLQSETNIVEHKHNCSLFFKPVKQHWFGFDFEYYGTNQKNKENYSVVFTNLSYFFKPNKGRLKFKLKCNNVFNESEIVRYYSSDIALTQTRFNIRGREFIASIYFEFSDFKRRK